METLLTIFCVVVVAFLFSACAEIRDLRQRLDQLEDETYCDCDEWEDEG